MDSLHKFTIKSEKAELKSDRSTEESIDLDFLIKIEVKAGNYIQNWDTEENQSLSVDNQEYYAGYLYNNFIDHDSVGQSCQDGSFRSLQEFPQEECTICHEVFLNRYHLIKHNSTHLRILVDFPKTYQCDYCSVFFTKKKKLEDHICSMHCNNNNDPNLGKLYRCSICQKRYKYKNWHEHMICVHGSEKFECTMCNVTFKCLRYLKTHNRNCHGNGYNQRGEFQCNYCPKKFNINDCLNKHIKNCHGAPAQCDICNSILKSVVYLKAHMRRVHYNDGKIHRCDICFKKFKSPRYVRIHIKNTHARLNSEVRNTRDYLSCECGESYLSVRKLESHLKVCPVALKV